MSPKRTIFILLVVIVCGQTLYYYPQMPETVMSHFDTAGTANGWMSKDMFFIFYGVLFLLMTIFAIGLPRYIERLPSSLINLPNKKYWLSPERCCATMDTLRNQLTWFGLIILVFIVIVMQFAIVANISPDRNFSSGTVLIILGIFLTGTLFWSINMIRHFAKIPTV